MDQQQHSTSEENNLFYDPQIQGGMLIPPAPCKWGPKVFRVEYYPEVIFQTTKYFED